MTILVIAAMRKELDLILKQMPDYEEKTVEDFTVYFGHIGGHEVIASQCGIGKVNSALRTRALIEEFHPDLVINSGVAGGVDASMHIGDVLVADRVAYHDVWCGPGTVYGEADGCPLYFTSPAECLDLMKKISEAQEKPFRFGLLCSGDKFICKPEEVTEIKSHFPGALGCDMESASIAQACYKADTPFMVVRVMSDMPGGGENLAEYTNFWSEAPARTFEALSKLISSL